LVGEGGVSPEINARDFSLVSFDNRDEHALPTIGARRLSSMAEIFVAPYSTVKATECTWSFAATVVRQFIVDVDLYLVATRRL